MSAARGIQAIAIGAWDEAAAETEHTVELARSGRNDDHVVDLLAGAAFAHPMAGNPDAAARLASESLNLARRAGGPAFIARRLTALAGSIADREPQRARALLAESLELQATIEFAACLRQHPHCAHRSRRRGPSCPTPAETPTVGDDSDLAGGADPNRHAVWTKADRMGGRWATVRSALLR